MDARRSEVGHNRAHSYRHSKNNRRSERSFGPVLIVPKEPFTVYSQLTLASLLVRTPTFESAVKVKTTGSGVIAVITPRPDELYNHNALARCLLSMVIPESDSESGYPHGWVFWRIRPRLSSSWQID